MHYRRPKWVESDTLDKFSNCPNAEDDKPRDNRNQNDFMPSSSYPRNKRTAYAKDSSREVGDKTKNGCQVNIPLSYK